MTVRKGTTGTGLTQKATLRWNPKEDRGSPEVAAALEVATLDGLIASIERACLPTLLNAGLPGSQGCYAYKSSGEWKPWADEDLFAGWGFAGTVEPIAQARGIAPDSPVGFAAAMMDRLQWLRHYEAVGDHARAALFAYYLGVLRAESRIKLEHEPVWKSGKGLHDNGAASRSGRSRADRVAAVDALTTPGPGRISKREAFKEVARLDGVTAKAVETDYYKAKKAS